MRWSFLRKYCNFVGVVLISRGICGVVQAVNLGQISRGLCHLICDGPQRWKIENWKLYFRAAILSSEENNRLAVRHSAKVFCSPPNWESLFSEESFMSPCQTRQSWNALKVLDFQLCDWKLKT